MSRLFIEFYLDEDVDVLVAHLIHARGFAVTTTQEADHIGWNDNEQLAYAVSRQMALLTHNRVDFETLAEQYFASGQTHCGILIAARRPPYQLAHRLLAILNAVTADEMDNQLRYV